MLKARHGRVFLEKRQKLFLDEVQRVRQYCAGIDAPSLVNQEGRDSKRADGALRLVVVMLVIVIDEPVHRRVDRHIDFRVVQRGDARQDYRRAVRLHCGAGVEVVHILQEDSHRNFLVRIVSGEIDADQRDEFDFRMGFQHFEDFFFGRVCGDYIQQIVHFDYRLSDCPTHDAQIKNATRTTALSAPIVWPHCRAFFLFTRIV